MTEGMRLYGKEHGMTEATLRLEFQHCTEHHRKQGSRFTDKGWESSVWNTWVLQWVKFGSKQIADPSALPPQAKCAWVNGGQCEEYARPQSKYCEPHGAIVKQVQDRHKGEVLMQVVK